MQIERIGYLGYKLYSLGVKFVLQNVFLDSCYFW
jgi:hypothetical protein